MIVAPTVTTIDICHVLIMLKAQCLIPYFTVSVNHKTTTSGSSTAQPPWSDLYTYARTELDKYHIVICELIDASCANIPAAEILLEVCCQFCHTALY